jgi:hypothetical protein
MPNVHFCDGFRMPAQCIGGVDNVLEGIVIGGGSGGNYSAGSGGSGAGAGGTTTFGSGDFEVQAAARNLPAIQAAYLRVPDR